MAAELVPPGFAEILLVVVLVFLLYDWTASEPPREH
jgi:hypothetical protein